METGGEVTTSTPKRQPKRFVKSQIPDSVLNDPSLNAAIATLPKNYNFEIHKIIWRIRSTAAKRVALQLPEGLLMFSLTLADIITAHSPADHCFVLADVAYGACCVDDLAAKALDADLLVHFGHSCLVPVTISAIPCLYVFVEISIDVTLLSQTIALNLSNSDSVVVLAGTIQFASAIRAAKPDLEKLGFVVKIPQSKPLSAGEVLGCTAPKISSGGSSSSVVVVFVADGRFHLEAMMIANPGAKFFRYDPYLSKMFLEEYDQRGMRETRRRAVAAAVPARHWGIIMGTLGRQGNPRIVADLEKKMTERGLSYTVVMMSEISPARVGLFEDSVEAWVQVACPRLSIDWGEAFHRPVLTPFEADVALGVVPGWWENRCCNNGNGDRTREEAAEVAVGGDYPMDYYAQDGGDWNSCYVKKKPLRSAPVVSVPH